MLTTGQDHLGDGHFEHPQPGRILRGLPPERAKAPRGRFEFYTPKHGSWLNVAGTEINEMIRQCLARRIDSCKEMAAEVAA